MYIILSRFKDIYTEKVKSLSIKIALAKLVVICFYYLLLCGSKN